MTKITCILHKNQHTFRSRLAQSFLDWESRRENQETHTVSAFTMQHFLSGDNRMSNNTKDTHPQIRFLKSGQSRSAMPYKT
jgi:hypothetical protein